MNPNNIQQSAYIEIINHLRQASSILIALNQNPDVDQLASAIALSLFLNKLGKHTTAVYSGVTPQMIDFLNPTQTIQKNTEMLQDFIISLDKNKADKLRYKVEDEFVKIYITPYNTTLSGQDLQFSQGEVNVDTVISLGVRSSDNFDSVLQAHPKVLHDSILITIDNQPASLENSTYRIIDQTASSIAEICTDLSIEIDENLLDNAIATAYLTGIVYSTDRYSNQKTTPKSLNTSARLITHGANQEIIAKHLSQTPQVPVDANINTNPLIEGAIAENMPTTVVEAPMIDELSAPVTQMPAFQPSTLENTGVEFGTNPVNEQNQLTQSTNIVDELPVVTEQNIPLQAVPVDTPPPAPKEESNTPIANPEQVASVLGVDPGNTTVVSEQEPEPEEIDIDEHGTLIHDAQDSDQNRPKGIVLPPNFDLTNVNIAPEVVAEIGKPVEPQISYNVSTASDTAVDGSNTSDNSQTDLGSVTISNLEQNLAGQNSQAQTDNSISSLLGNLDPVNLSEQSDVSTTAPSTPPPLPFLDNQPANQ